MDPARQDPARADLYWLPLGAGEAIEMPARGRAPGWSAGLIVAGRQEVSTCRRPRLRRPVKGGKA